MAKLKEGFPGLAELEAAGITTEAQLRKVIKTDEKGWPAGIPGVGPVTAEEIISALAGSEEGESEPPKTVKMYREGEPPNEADVNEAEVEAWAGLGWSTTKPKEKE